MFFMFLAQYSYTCNCHPNQTPEEDGIREKAGRLTLTLEAIGDLNLLLPGLSATKKKKSLSFLNDGLVELLSNWVQVLCLSIFSVYGSSYKT